MKPAKTTMLAPPKELRLSVLEGITVGELVAVAFRIQYGFPLPAAPIGGRAAPTPLLTQPAAS